MMHNLIQQCDKKLSLFHLIYYDLLHGHVRIHNAHYDVHDAHAHNCIHHDDVYVLHDDGDDEHLFLQL